MIAFGYFTIARCKHYPGFGNRSPLSCVQTMDVVDPVDEVNKKTYPLADEVHGVQNVHGVQKFECRIRILTAESKITCCRVQNGKKAKRTV